MPDWNGGHAGYGIWNLGFGIQDLGFRIWNLRPGI